ncbi:MAG: dihydrofolate synthase/folylpolyglutamate synthase [Gammaproteobacteria bacterium]|jgi:dihydrofolate synthase/folylpolyglutamate synthase
MRFENLDDWLQWQMSLHHKAIDLGLDRVQQVAQNLSINQIADKVIIIAGTNGKGSTVAAYESWLVNAGFRVGSYTSPHLLKYNERIRINRCEVSDWDLCLAFDAIDTARGEVALTYFEFGTLAALWLIQLEKPDFALLEVGLGGRLDAVNIIDADMVHLTNIGIDHQSWLGDTRELIGFEKAGVLRNGIPVIANDSDLPRSVQSEIKAKHCFLAQFEKDFSVEKVTDKTGGFKWTCEDLDFDLVSPLAGDHQIQNLAAVVAGLAQWFDLSKIDSIEMNRRFEGTYLAGRFESVDAGLPAKTWIDVGHNRDAAKVLAHNLATLKKSANRVIVLLGMLEDKNPEEFVQKLQSVVDEWWLITLGGDRGLSAAELTLRVGNNIQVSVALNDLDELRRYALSNLTNEDILLVTGSFLTIELFLSAMPFPQTMDRPLDIQP